MTACRDPRIVRVQIERQLVDALPCLGLRDRLVTDPLVQTDHLVSADYGDFTGYHHHPRDHGQRDRYGPIAIQTPFATDQPALLDAGHLAKAAKDPDGRGRCSEGPNNSGQRGAKENERANHNRNEKNLPICAGHAVHGTLPCLRDTASDHGPRGKDARLIEFLESRGQRISDEVKQLADSFRHGKSHIDAAMDAIPREGLSQAERDQLSWEARWKALARMADDSSSESEKQLVRLVAQKLLAIPYASKPVDMPHEEWSEPLIDKAFEEAQEELSRR